MAVCFLAGQDQILYVCIAAVCWGIWNVCNKVTFEKHKMQSPMEVVFIICTFLLYWELGRFTQKRGARRLQGRSRDIDERGYHSCVSHELGFCRGREHLVFLEAECLE